MLQATLTFDWSRRQGRKIKRLRLVFLWLLLLAATTGWAQPASSPRDFPRFYAGLQLARTQYTVIYKPSGVANAIRLSPWRVTAGYQFTPRLALELGGMYQVDNFDQSATGITVSGQAIQDIHSDKSWKSSVPLLARYTLTRAALGKVHIDALAGVTRTTARAESHYTHTVEGEVLAEKHDKNHKTSLYYTAGFSARYGFGRHWQAVLDWTVNRNTEPWSSGLSLLVLGRKTDLTYAYGLGLRYCFDVKQKQKD